MSKPPRLGIARRPSDPVVVRYGPERLAEPQRPSILIARVLAQCPLWHDAVMALKRLGFIAAQLMPKPGARQVLARVVTVDDLPGGGWSVIDERTWRSVTAWRSFEAVAARQWCWVQVMPLVSEPDALSALEGIGDRLLRNLRAEVTLLREHDVAIEAFPGAGRVWAHEQHTIGPDGEGVARTLAAACGAYLIVVAASGSPEWPWDSVVSVARRQAGLVAA